jgi:8-amino-7-oxononanoate synthase
VEVEQKLAQMKGFAAARVFGAGFLANATLLPALCDRDTRILMDQLAHRSLISGAQASVAEWKRFRHNDLGHLRQLLDQSKEAGKRPLVVTESVFSMDGDLCDIDAVCKLAQEYQALLLLDEAHATGVFGETGMGCFHGPASGVIVVGTFSKGLGSFGAYVACSTEWAYFLDNHCAGLIYTTALPAPILAGIKAGLESVEDKPSSGAQLLEKARWLRAELNSMGWDTGHSASQIIPLILGDEQRALKMQQALLGEGVLVSAIRPPTVPIGSSRLRITLTSQHSLGHCRRLLRALETVKVC